MQLFPSFVFPDTWLPGYNRQPFPNIAKGPTVQKGPTETPYIHIKLYEYLRMAKDELNSSEKNQKNTI